MPSPNPRAAPVTKARFDFDLSPDMDMDYFRK